MSMRGAGDDGRGGGRGPEGARGKSGSEPGRRGGPSARRGRGALAVLPVSPEAAHEERMAGHVRRHKARGTPPPRRDRGLSREEIVEAAIAVADAEGPDAISMRR